MSARLEAQPAAAQSGVDTSALQRMADGMPDPVFFKDLEHRWVAFNRAFCDMLGRPASDLLGRSDPDFFPPEQVEVFWRHDEMVFSSGRADLNEERITSADGLVRVIWTRKTPVYADSGGIVGLFGIIMDITNQETHRRAVEILEAEARHQASLIIAQRRLIDSLVVPVLEVWDGILLLPLVGAPSQGRVSSALESVLKSIVDRRAHTVLFDVTGAGKIDAEVTETLARAMSAVKLLGCRTILVGIGALGAKALVDSGVDLGSIAACATLKQGLSRALGAVERPGR